jgi:pilus assembly protein CpaE
LGDAFAGTIPNNYSLVREAIDRGVPLEDVKPRNNIVSELRKMLEQPEQAKPSMVSVGRSGR